MFLYDRNKKLKFNTQIRENFQRSEDTGEYNARKIMFDVETEPTIDFDNNVASIYGYKHATGYDTRPKQVVSTCTDNDGIMGETRWVGTTNLRCDDTYVSATKRLTGPPNPKTLLAPIVAPPITDIQAWGTDNYVGHSAVNDHFTDELYLSGYSVGGGETTVDDLYEGFRRHSDPEDDDDEQQQILQNFAISRVPYRPASKADSRRTTECAYREGYSAASGDASLVTDPRMSGYGDPNRSYVDRVLGNPKFYYDDVNVARAPNYITRNKIDVFSFGESTGALRDPADDRGSVNQLAVNRYHESALEHRSDLMRSLMRKRNREMQQRREFPISTNGQRMLGGMSKI
jgi:hypothetical protein